MDIIVKPLLKESYLAMIRNSVGSQQYRNAFALVDGQHEDITKNGVLSCAFFASSVLVIFKLIKEMHVTVEGTMRDLEASGWHRVETPTVGSVLVWEPISHPIGFSHGRHIGFALGNDRAISNNSETGSPSEHQLNFSEQGGQPVRQLEAIYSYPSLE